LSIVVPATAPGGWTAALFRPIEQGENMDHGRFSDARRRACSGAARLVLGGANCTGCTDVDGDDVRDSGSRQETCSKELENNGEGSKGGTRCTRHGGRRHRKNSGLVAWGGRGRSTPHGVPASWTKAGCKGPDVGADLRKNSPRAQETAHALDKWRKRTGIEPARDSRTAPHRF
jgi:hypothetical protein